MGSRIHVAVVGGPAGLVAHAEPRFADLEARWSRFRGASEIRRLNRSAGSFTSVSPETMLLVERALEGWRLTDGLFDPTVLGDLIRAGYDRSLDELRRAPPGQAPASCLVTGARMIELAGGQIRLPDGVGFDPGGVGKGLAADMIASELVELGAEGALVNAGGDLRAIGVGPDDGAWTIALSHPRRSEPVALIGLDEGAVATSTTLLRRWRVAGADRHHLIDPASGRPVDGPLELASVVAAEAWLAEVWAKALLLGPGDALGRLARSGLSGLVVDRDGRVTASAGLQAYLGSARLVGSI